MVNAPYALSRNFVFWKPGILVCVCTTFLGSSSCVSNTYILEAHDSRYIEFTQSNEYPPPLPVEF
ncbi:hypothetical protein BKA82DRAFT_995950 [Pisolithus tinctorius]|uniref:Uncharacterized protein n=1 Tax=Pisolithus tinctorius Marx 270 TaxID=870435 RepID=A0A0C3PMD3_PISTI|nr:hypothetical protein BKA82DRAFT_995950 [Pisolithus tinctorius]KIO09966.1 hypothetical protein M404DRAFT_995950 [Pisolithus tinctorius Marx 270]